MSTEHLQPPNFAKSKKKKKSAKLAVTRDDIDFAMLLSNQKKPERINQQKKELTIDEILTEKIPKRVNANIENQVKKKMKRASGRDSK